MKVLIVGGGIGGLALGAFLKKCAIDFDIIEKSPNWDRQGFSLGIWDNGRDMLNKLGVAELFDTQGQRIKDYYLYNTAGRLVKHADLMGFYSRYGSAYTHINRGKLHDWLLGKAGQEKVRMGITLTALNKDSEHVVAVFSDGRQEAYDVVVGADGVHSQVRKLEFRASDTEHYIQWRSWFFWTDNKFKKEHGILQYSGKGRFLSIFDDKEKTLCVALAQIPHSIWDEEKGRVERMAKTFKDFRTLFPDLLKGLTDKDLMPTDIATIQMKRWFRGRVVLLGDAAHAMEPYAGLGASMAMEDAYVLAGEFMKVSNTYPLTEALSNYERVRKARVARARSANMSLHQWLLSTSMFWNMLVGLLAPFLPTSHFTSKFHSLMKEEL